MAKGARRPVEAVQEEFGDLRRLGCGVAGQGLKETGELSIRSIFPATKVASSTSRPSEVTQKPSRKSTVASCIRARMERGAREPGIRADLVEAIQAPRLLVRAEQGEAGFGAPRVCHRRAPRGLRSSRRRSPAP